MRAQKCILQLNPSDTDVPAHKADAKQMQVRFETVTWHHQCIRGDDTPNPLQHLAVTPPHRPQHIHLFAIARLFESLTHTSRASLWCCYFGVLGDNDTDVRQHLHDDAQ
jgi:hypothetical protein